MTGADDEQVDDDQCRHHHGENEHVQEVHARDRLIGQTRATEHGVGNPSSDQGGAIGHVDADRRGAEGQAVPRQQIARIAEEDGEEHQSHTDQPVEFAGVAVGTGEVDSAHV